MIFVFFEIQLIESTHHKCGFIIQPSLYTSSIENVDNPHPDLAILVILSHTLGPYFAFAWHWGGCPSPFFSFCVYRWSWSHYSAYLLQIQQTYCLYSRVYNCRDGCHHCHSSFYLKIGLAIDQRRHLRGLSRTTRIHLLLESFLRDWGSWKNPRKEISMQTYQILKQHRESSSEKIYHSNPQCSGRESQQ